MFIESKPKRETLASRVLSRAFDYGVSNPLGSIFDRKFNRDFTQREIDKSEYSVGQSVKELSYPNGMSPDGYSSFSPTMGVNVSKMDGKRAFEATAENQVHMFWKKNRERCLKYHRVAGRAEVKEALAEMCNEAIYPNDSDEVCSLKIDKDATIGDSIKVKLHKIFRQDVVKKITDFNDEGWDLMRTLLIEGRVFLEVLYNTEDDEISGLNLLPSQNMIIIVQDGVVLGYRQMLENANGADANGGKNYIDFSPNQILYGDLGMYGPGGINDPRSPLEVAVKPFNQLNAVEDSIVMYRIQWGSEKLVFKIDTGMMPKPKAEKHMKDQAKLLSRRVDYNTGTGEITNYGRVIGLGEHFFMSVSNQTANSSIERLPSGDNVSNIEDLKYFKRNLVNSLMTPPGRVTALAGDGENYSTGKIGEVTQAEVSFARMVYRYQRPLGKVLRRLFVMVLNTKNMLSDDIKSEDYYDIKFNKANSFQNYIDSEILNTNINTFKGLMEFAVTDENPNAPLSQRFALVRGLKLTDAEISQNYEWKLEEEKARNKAKGEGTE